MSVWINVQRRLFESCPFKRCKYTTMLLLSVLGRRSLSTASKSVLLTETISGGSVGLIRLNRPPVNALNSHLVRSV